MSRSFDNASYVTLSQGAQPSSLNGKSTAAALFRAGTPSGYDQVYGVDQSQFSGNGAIYVESDNGSWSTIYANNTSFTPSFDPTGKWVVIVIVQRANSGQVDAHMLDVAAGTWYHHTNIGNGIGSDTWYETVIGAGNWNGKNDYFNGDIEWVWYKENWADLTADADIEAIFGSGSYARLLALDPTFFVVLDQSATTTKVVDLTGKGANEASLTGTAVGTNSAPSWNWGAQIEIKASTGAAQAQTTRSMQQFRLRRV